jgi:hypothetical protein
MNIVKGNIEAIAAVVAVVVLAYFTPEVISAIGVQAGQFIQSLVIAVITGAVVWFTKRQQ